MKRQILLIILASTPFFTHANQTIVNELSSVEVFSLGFNGFAAKKMPQQITYENALKEKNAVLIFRNTLTSPRSTQEGKAYAACGLRRSNQLNNIPLGNGLQNLEVTTLKADILRKENLGNVISWITLYGCN